MQLRTLLATALVAAGAMAAPAPEPAPEPSFLSNIFGNLPIYCMNDWQAQQVVSGFMNILTNPNRQAANATAQTLIADNYEEISDSINSLAGYPLGSITFNGKQAFINGVINAPYISGMTTLAIYHDCTHITWRWLVTGLGSRVAEVKGVNVMTINTQGQIVEDDIEFNSIAWGSDIASCDSSPVHRVQT